MVDETTEVETTEDDPRTNREHASRKTETRSEPWAPVSKLPVPDPQDGYTFRWIRTAMRGQEDIQNVSRRFREGWEPVRLEDHPELKLIADIETRFDGMAVSSGLMLCKIATEVIDSKREYLRGEAENQMEAVDQNYMRQNDARMPLLSPDRKSRVTFGDGS